MSGEAAASILAVQTVQALLSLFESSMAFGAYLCPIDTTTDTITATSFDYIIVGGGTAGSVLANRLSVCTDANVLLLEAGGCPPLESNCLGYFTLQPQSGYDYNISSVDDSYSCQNLQNNVVSLTAGKMLGGSSSIHHGIWVKGFPADYDPWARAANDRSWSFAGLWPYFIKSESVQDPSSLNGYEMWSGTSGPTAIKRQPSSENIGIFEAFADIGYTVVNNTNAAFSVPVVTEPQLTVGNCLRQSGLVSYISPVKNRTNLFVLTGATVSKVNFDDTTATGVTFTYDDVEYTVTASQEVILSAGAIKTPQLLMLSGIGPSDHLTEMGIEVLADLPVGENLQDHVSASVLFGLEEDTSTTPSASPFQFPVPATCNYINLNSNTAGYAEYQSINLVFPHDSAGLLQLCMNSFKYTETICQAMYEANVGRKILWAVNNVLHPVSRGSILLNTTDINDQPLVNLGLLSDSEDLVNLAAFLSHMAQLLDTTYFQSIGAEFIDLGLCTDYESLSDEFWQCYALAMSSTMWHYSGTAAMGSVVDNQLKVIGMSNLRVVDASIMPSLPSGNIIAAVIASAEKIADDIIAERTTCTAAASYFGVSCKNC